MKPWQIVVVVLAVVAVGISVWYTFLSGDEVPISDGMRMVDVRNDKLHSMKYGPGGPSIPGFSPDDKVLALLPVHEKEPGKLFVSERYLSGLRHIEVPNNVVDPKTGEVRQPAPQEQR